MERICEAVIEHSTSERERHQQADVEADVASIRAILGGQRERFADLVERYKGVVAAVVRRHVGDQNAVDDVAQEVFLSAYKSLPRLREPALFGPWLLQIARRMATRAAQNARLRKHDDLIGTEPAPEPEPAVHERMAVVLAKVEELPEPYRRVVLLKYQSDLNCREIAEREGVALGTITSRLVRAMSLLRVALCDPEGRNK